MNRYWCALDVEQFALLLHGLYGVKKRQVEKRDSQKEQIC